MKISGNLTIEDLQRQFQNTFPHLKIELYSLAHQSGKGSEVTTQLNNNLRLGKISPGIPDAEFVLNKEMTVREFEAAMEKDFKLHVQVFRKSANLWLQTASTDHWTLEKQEGKGGRSEVFAK